MTAEILVNYYILQARSRHCAHQTASVQGAQPAPPRGNGSKVPFSYWYPPLNNAVD